MKDMKGETDSKIPYGRPVRVGNFRLWRGRYTVTVAPDGEQRKKKADGRRGRARGRRVEIDRICVSSLDGSWSVSIPAGFEQYGMLCVAYAWYAAGSEDERRRGGDYLSAALSNMYYVSCICNGFFHRGVQLVAAAYSDPGVLRDGERRERLAEDLKSAADGYLAWREAYDAQAAQAAPDDTEERQEELAGRALEIASGGE